MGGQIVDRDSARCPRRSGLVILDPLVGAHVAGAVEVADFPPTDQAREVHQVLKERLARYRDELDELLRTDVPAFNGILRERQLAPVITTTTLP